MKRSLQVMGISTSVIFIGGGIFVYKCFYLFSPLLNPLIGPIGNKWEDYLVKINDLIKSINVNTILTYHFIGILLIACGIFLGILLFGLSFFAKNNK
jgi:hypothetical protein